MRINYLVELIFAHAVAMDQRGGLRNTIFAIDEEVFIMSYCHTVLLRFTLRSSEPPFKQPFSFYANDYDSNIFEVKDGKIIFYKETKSWTRKKTAGSSRFTPEQIKKVHDKYFSELSGRQKLEFPKKVIALLDDDLDHIEFSGESGARLNMVQRNIYSGEHIKIETPEIPLFKEKIEVSFGPIVVNIKDFKALFSFQKTLNFYFPRKAECDFIIVENINKKVRDMSCILTCSMYNELIKVQEENYGHRNT